MLDINGYLEKYEELKKEINTINTNLDDAKDISALNVTEAIANCVSTFKLMKSVDRSALSEEQISEVDKKNDEIKSEIIKLKNKQIYKYNLQVEKINEKISMLKNVSSLSVQEDIKNLKLLKWCNVYLYGDWQKKNYASSLDYEGLQQMFDKLAEIEKKYNIQNNELADLTVKINYFVQLLDDTKKEIKEDMSLATVKTLLDKCMDIYRNVINLDINVRMAFEEGIINKEVFARYNDKTTVLSRQLPKVISNLLLKKKDLDERSNNYTLIVDKMKVLQVQASKLSEEIKNCYGKCNKAILNRFKDYLNKLNSKLSKIEKEAHDVELNTQQKKLLFDKNGEFEQMRSLFEKLNNELNKDPKILGANFDAYVNDCMKELEDSIKNLDDMVRLLEKPLKDKDKMQRVNSLVDDIKNRISHIDTLVSKVGNVDLKNKLNKHEDVFNKICKTYNSKCPLFVKRVRPADKVYKKYQKECLRVSGLSSISLLEKPVLIPTIMHGNIMLQQKLPVFKKFTDFVNNILGGVINAKRDENGEWMLSNGYKIGPSVACTSLLKNMAVSDSKLVSSSLVQKVRNLMTMMTLKKNHAVNKYKDVKLALEKQKLEIKFLSSGLSVEEFCKQNNLSDVERKVIETCYEYQNSKKGRSK